MKLEPQSFYGQTHCVTMTGLVAAVLLCSAVLKLKVTDHQ